MENAASDVEAPSDLLEDVCAERPPVDSETLKALAVFDGAFVVTNEGVAGSGARYLDADATGQVTVLSRVE